MKRGMLLLLVLCFGLNLSAYDKKSLVERFTNASCAPCASINNSWYNSTISNLIQNNTISHVIYHVWWPGAGDPMYILNQPDNTTRTNYYGVTAVPWIDVNGVNTSTQSGATPLLNNVNNGNSQFSPFKIVITQRALSENRVEIGLKIFRDPTDVTTFGTTKLLVALTEKSVSFASPPGNNGESHFSSVCRKMLPDGNGTVLTIPAPGDSVEFVLSYVPTTAFLAAVNLDNLRIVAFIQDQSTKVVYQSEMFELIPNYKAAINSDSPDVIGDNTTPVSFNAVLRNIGFSTDKYTINSSLNSPTGWTGEFTTTNGTYPFGTEDSLEIAPGDSTVIHISVNPQGVNGFGRTTIGFSSINNPGLMNDIAFNNMTQTGIDVLIVNAGNRQYESAVTNSLDSVYTGTYGSVLRSALEPAYISLSDFKVVIWQGSNSERAFYPDEVTKLQSYLDNGGNLLITGQNIGSDIFETTGQSQFAQDFYHNYLHANYVANAATFFIIKGIANDFISDGIQFIANEIYTRSLDKITPGDTNAVKFLTYFNGPDIAGIRAEADNYRIIYMSASFEQITELPVRDTLAARSLRWLLENVAVGVDQEDNLPVQFALGQNYPNPFNPTTTINFSIPEKSFTTLKIYDILGNEVATLLSEEKPAGSYEVQFNSAKLSSGVYLYKLQSNNFVQTKKMMLLK